MPSAVPLGESANPGKPALPKGVLSRDRVLALDQGRPILVIEAPSGFGKSMLAGMWLDRRRSRSPCSWVSLDATSRDPVVLMDQLILALGGDGYASDDVVMLSDEAALAERFSYISSRLADDSLSLSLVIDDAHCLAGSQSRIYLERLLQGATLSVRVCITMQPLNLEIGLGNLTALGRVSWIHANHLAWTQDEVATFAPMRGQALSPGQIHWLYQATEGWPVLVQLALAVPLQSMPSLRGGVAGLGPIREFIYERFIEGLSPDERDVLWILTCLGNAPVQLLNDLEESDSKVDDALQRFRSLGIVQYSEPDDHSAVYLHALVRDAASRLIDSGRLTGRSKLIETAARWYWRKGSSTAAIRLALDPGCKQTDLALEWLLEIGFSLIFRSGQLQTLLDLVEAWEQLAGRSSPALDQLAVWALVLQRRFGLAEIRLNRADEFDARSGSTGTAVLQRALQANLQDDHLLGGRLARQWMERNPGVQNYERGVAAAIDAYHLKCIGHTEEALVTLRQAHHSFDAAQFAYGIQWTHLVGALVFIRAGHYRAALAQVETGLAGCPNVHGFGSLRAMLHAIEAFLRYERNELDGVRGILDETLPLLAEQGSVDPIVLGYVAAGRSRVAAGDFGTALDILSEGELIGVRRNFPRLTICLRAERALLLSRSGAINQARALLEMPAAIDASSPGYSLIRDRHQRMKARFALISGDGAQACAALTPLVDEARTGGRQGKLCEFLILRALAEDLRGNEAAAFEALSEALDLGSANGYFRTFVDEGRALDTLTDHWLKRSKPTNRSAVALATRLLEFAGIPRVAAPEKAPDIALTKRERQILRLLDEGLTNAQVAGRCFISEGTVKWYLHNLYEKCGVGNRTGLLRHVRALGLKL